MRILHIFDHSLPLQSGYVTRSLAILTAQRARGWQTLHLTSPRHDFHHGPTADEETIDGWTFARTHAPRAPLAGLRALAEMRAIRRRLSHLMRRERPDILHAHSPVLNALPAISVGRECGVPVVYEVRALWEDAAVDHGDSREGDLRYLLSRWLDTRALKRADGIVALCEPLRKEIINRGIAPDRVTVVPNAVDPQFLVCGEEPNPGIRRSSDLNNVPVLGFIGSFYAYEGLDLLLEAMKLLHEQGMAVAAILVGGGPEEKALRDLAARLGLEHHVRFTGRVPLGEVTRYFPLIDLLVFPRRRNRLTELVTPLKPLEAMAQRRPLVASNVGGHRELIRDNETGFLVPPDDANALAAGIARALSDPARLQRMTEEGRRFVERERNWDVVCATYEGVYERALARRARR